jgi:flagellum-specific peptidoglycan hydrolase FlgJ
MAIGFFDGNKADASPESIKRKRAMIAQMMASSRAPRNIGEGLNSIGDSIASSILGYRADNAERQVNASSAEAMRNIYSGFGSPMASAGNPVATGSATGSGATRAPQSFTGTQTEFVAKIMPYAVQEGERTGVDPRIIVAQAALESGYGRSAPGNNFFGIKSHGKPGGQTFATTEVINGQTKRINDSFRTFASMGDSVRGYGDFLQQNPRYRPMLEARGLDAQIAALGRSGYATDPNYASKIRSIASGIRMPVINPGNGATPMPLASQQARTAPMPNVAPVQGDNAQRLLADAAYYERNGNPEAARQMRERARMSQNMPVQTASAGPQANDAQMQDGAGELQAGGSEMMGGGYNPFLPRDMAPTADAMGQGIADNEEQTRIMEAQMAAEQGLPYAGNEPGQFNSMFSPDLMGGGLNPFVPRDMVQPEDAIAQAPVPMPPQMDRATFDQVTAGLPQRAPAFAGQGLAPSWAGDPDKLAPGAEQASFVIPARDTVALPAANNRPPQSPLVPQAMRAPLPVDMGGENSGGSAMQFIESEFARREGRPDPRTAIGAPQGYNPFVQQPTPAPQMPAGGGSVQGVSQGDTVASGPAQAPAQANSRIAELASIAGNPMVRPEVRQLAMAEIQTERARAQAEADRARQEQQTDELARDLGLTRAEARNPEVVKRRAEERFRQKPGPNTELMRDPNTGEIVAVDRNNPDAGVKVLRQGGADPRAPTTKTIKQPDGSEVAVQWNPNSKTWEPLTAPEGGNAVRAPAKLTEAQGKDLVYYNRGIQALADLGDGSALTGVEGIIGNTIGQVPVLGNYAKSEEFQKAEQSGRNFLNSILRKDTGAAITSQEMSIYGGVFLPQPGDSVAVIKQKNEARRQAIDAIRDGLGPADVLALGQRLTRREDARTPTPDRPGAPTAPGTTSAPPPSPAQGGFRILKVE